MSIINTKSTKRVNEIRQSILKLNTELLKLQPGLEKSKAINNKYNKLLVQKAVLKKELDELQASKTKGIFKFFKSKKEKLISDYFAS